MAKEYGGKMKREKTGPYMSNKARSMEGVGAQDSTAHIKDMGHIIDEDLEYSHDYEAHKKATGKADTEKLRGNPVKTYRQP